MEIRKSSESDRVEISNFHREAFGEEEGPVVARLVNDLLDDKSAMPLLSLVATEGSKIIGHILFTNVTLSPNSASVSAQILAPLAVLPKAQKRGVGGKLIKEGLSQLKQSGVGLVFVLGHPDYYPRSGFTPAGVLGYEAPYPIAVENAGAWMVQALSAGIIGKFKGTVQCSDALSKPELWRE